MSTLPWLGLEPVPQYRMAWGARAIFHAHSKTPIDIVWDRQSFDRRDRPESEAEVLQRLINKRVLPVLNTEAAEMSVDSTDACVRYFEWPLSPDWVVVAVGSPRASYGYFYIAVSLVNRLNPEIPREYRRAEDIRRRYHSALKQLRIDRRARSEAARQASEDADAAFLAKISVIKQPGDRLKVGDGVEVEANRQLRMSRVIGVHPDGETALVEYRRTGGDLCLREITTDDHTTLANFSRRRLPKRWRKLA